MPVQDVMPLLEKTAAAVQASPPPEGLIDVAIEGTHLTLLGMRDPAATPDMDQRLAMARRLNEVGPKLPRYVKSIQKAFGIPAIRAIAHSG
jgi:hypothetical protein